MRKTLPLKKTRFVLYSTRLFGLNQLNLNYTNVIVVPYSFAVILKNVHINLYLLEYRLHGGLGGSLVLRFSTDKALKMTRLTTDDVVSGGSESCTNTLQQDNNSQALNPQHWIGRQPHYQ